MIYDKDTDTSNGAWDLIDATIDEWHESAIAITSWRSTYKAFNFNGYFLSVLFDKWKY
ncbi:hypothetical protein H6G25_20030 [Dolichospermum sp. FACHB-1091]|uniref:hypothetical protein n=1 Tax=Dolichospermum sp. FACHB-1091 TaxID=2692798 RepID=UPI001681B650|nr:hypothetical protein [Dolichospermum sp. FACHB-1091]MBD2445419.1 hypothetical protein [Dolichospermum sp. FACHB-1091]